MTFNFCFSIKPWAKGLLVLCLRRAFGPCSPGGYGRFSRIFVYFGERVSVSPKRRIVRAFAFRLGIREPVHSRRSTGPAIPRTASRLSSIANGEERLWHIFQNWHYFSIWPARRN